MNGILTILSASAGAAACASLGALFLIGRDRPPTVWLGWANSTAAGLMLGGAFVLSLEGLSADALLGTAGAVAGALFVFWTHRFSGTSELPLNVLDDSQPDYGYKVLTVHTLHSASEGVAIGVAAAIDLPFGLFMAFVFAVHNVAEAMVLCAVLRSHGVSLPHAAALSVITNASQVLLAVVVLAVVLSAPAILPVVLGFAFGTLVYLVMVELLPEAYAQAGDPSIALLTILAMGVIALIEGLIL